MFSVQRRAAFFGTSLPAARRGAAIAAQAPQLVVRAAGQQISADVEKPIGLTFKESKAKGGGLVVTVRAFLCPGFGSRKGQVSAAERCPPRLTLMEHKAMGDGFHAMLVHVE